MASIRKRGSSYLIVVSMGYDYNGKRINPRQKTVHPPEELTPRQAEKWLNEQAVLFERDCRHTPQPVQQLTLAKYIDLWLTDIAPGKLAKSTIRRDRQDIERILPALGHYKLTELRPEHFRNFYAELRKVIRPDTKKPLSEYTIEGVHATLCSILSDAVEGGFLSHRKFMLTFPAGDRGCDHCGTVPVAHIVLENDHRTDSALLGANYRPQVCIVDITPADVLFAVCFHHLHPLFFWLNTTKIGTASLITRSLAGLEW